MKSDLTLNIGTKYNGDGMKKLGSAMKSTSKTVANTSRVIGSLSSELQGVSGQAGRAAGAIGGLFQSLLAGGPAGLVIAGITTAVGFLVKAFNDAQEKAKEAAKAMAESFVNAAKKISSAYDKVAQKLSSFMGMEREYANLKKASIDVGGTGRATDITSAAMDERSGMAAGSYAARMSRIREERDLALNAENDSFEKKKIDVRLAREGEDIAFQKLQQLQFKGFDLEEQLKQGDLKNYSTKGWSEDWVKSRKEIKELLEKNKEEIQKANDEWVAATGRKAVAEQEIPVAEKKHALVLRQINEKYEQQAKALDDERKKRMAAMGDALKKAVAQAGKEVRDNKVKQLGEERKKLMDAEKKSAVERLEEHEKEKDAAKKLADAEKKAADVLEQFRQNPNQNFNAWNAGQNAAQRDADKAARRRQRNIQQAQDQANAVAGRVFERNGRIKRTANNFDIGRFAEQSEYLGFDNITGNQLQSLRNKRDQLRNKLFNKDGTVKKGVSEIGQEMGLFKKLDKSLKKADAVQEAKKLKDEAKNRERRRAENEDKRTRALENLDRQMKQLV